MLKMKKLLEYVVILIIITLFIKGVDTIINKFGVTNVLLSWLGISIGGAILLYVIITKNRRK